MTQPKPAHNTIDLQIDEAYASQIDSGSLVRAIEETLNQAGICGADLTVVVTGDDPVRVLNRDYLGIDQPTDVLSFPSHDVTGPATETGHAIVLPPHLTAQMESYLGDIVMAFPYIAQQAARHAVSVSAELRLMVVHGTLHLLGFDHDTAEAKEQMWAAQDAVLAVFGEHASLQRTYEA